ncbi:MAG: SUMF1/EgtB/PvdO family nonheme iron enzyme [Polyangiaceae bacterium]
MSQHRRVTFSSAGPWLATLTLGGGAWLACQGEPERPRPRPAPVVVLAPAPPVMECRFEPRSLVERPGARGNEMCFSSAEQEPWWLQMTADAQTIENVESRDAADATDATSTDAEAPAACPPEMILVEGEYCPKLRQRCLRYLDDRGPGGFLSHHRCAEFATDVECAGEREHRRFCIDRDEYVPEEAELPLIDQSWTMSRELCESLGKRLCFESEWEFACEGEEMRPYPYGFSRNAKLCNHDLTDLSRRGKLRDLRVAPASRPECVSPFGVRNMVGNVDEWTIRDGFVRPWRASLRGGWWLAGRNNCRAATTGHDEYYFGPQTGVRCCKNPR